jgi:hypothetical protein
LTLVAELGQHPPTWQGAVEQLRGRDLNRQAAFDRRIADAAARSARIQIVKLKGKRK